MKLRSYQPSDYKQVKQLLIKCKLFDKSYDKKGKFDRKKPKGSIIIADDNNKVIGCIFYTFDGWDSSVYRLAVMPACRKQGIGSKLLMEAEKRLKKKGADVSSLRVHVRKKTALKFLRKRGYYGNWGPYWDLEKKI